MVKIIERGIHTYADAHKIQSLHTHYTVEFNREKDWLRKYSSALYLLEEELKKIASKKKKTKN